MVELVYKPISSIYKLILVTVVVVPLLGVFIALLQVWSNFAGWRDVSLFIMLYFCTMYGVTIGDHRLFTHRSFVASRPLKWALGILSCFGWQGAPIPWTADHIFHHTHSDTVSDIHSPHNEESIFRGLVFAHFGWLFSGKQADPRVYAKHLLTDSDVVLISKFYPVWLVLSLLIPFLIGGWTGLLWGGLVRIAVVHHVTWSINSICHVFGAQTFATNDESRDNLLVAAVSGGEGNHNGHHAIPRSARHALWARHWWQWILFDSSYVVIRLFARLGLASEVQHSSDELVATKLRRS